MVNKKRKNPNKIQRRKKRIPATKGAKTTTKSGDSVEVVLPTKTKIVYRTKRGDTKRIKDLEQQLQQKRTQPVRRANVLPQDLSAYGGYTGLTSGFGIKTKTDDKINSRLDRLDKKLDNLAERQNNPSVDLKPELLTRKKPEITEVKTTRTIPTQTRKDTRHRGYVRPYISGDLSGEEKYNQIQKEKDKKDKAAIQIQNLFRKKQAKDILHGLQEQHLQDVENYRNRQEANKRKEALRQSKIRGKIAFDREQERQVERQIEDRQKRDRLKQIEQLKKDDLRKKEELDEFILLEQSTQKEDDVREPEGFIRPTKKPDEIISEFDERNKSKSIFGTEARQQQLIGEIQETQRDIEDTTQQLIQEVDDEEFEDVRDFEPEEPPQPRQIIPQPITLPQPNILPTEAVEKPDDEPQDINIPKEPEIIKKEEIKFKLPVSRSEISTQTSAVKQGGLAERARRIAEERAIPNIYRGRNIAQEVPEDFEPFVEFPDAEREFPDAEPERIVEEPPKVQDVRGKLREEAEKLRRISDREATPRELQIATEKQDRIEKERAREEERKQKVIEERRQEAAAVKIQQVARQRQQEQKEFLRKAQEESDLRARGQGAPAITEDKVRQRYFQRTGQRYNDELPEEVKNALGQRNTLADEQKRLLIVLANLGLNGTTIPFSARDLTPVSGGFAKDDERLRQVIDLVKNSGNPMVRRQLKDIEKNVRQFNDNKKQIKKIQNKITSLEKKL